MRLASARVHEEEIDAEGSWAVSYGDMVTLLLTFFIVFFTIDPKAASQQNERLKVSLMNVLESSSANEVYQGVQNEMSMGKDKEKGIDKEIFKDWNGVVHDRGQYVLVEFPTVSFFNSAQTDLSRAGEKALKDFAKVYMPFAGSYQLGIRAYADPRAVRPHKFARFKDNLELTALRSVAAMRSLQNAGVPLARIKVGGFGETIATAQELNSIPAEKRSPTSELDLARKVVLVIEPEASK